MKAKEDLPLRDIIFASLREQILHGDLQPGTHLGEVALADRFGVSRTPLREAIRLLEQEYFRHRQVHQSHFNIHSGEKL